MSRDPHLLEALRSTVGTFVDADRAHDTVRHRLGDSTLILRRDCHGALRRMEIRIPPQRRSQLKDVLRGTQRWMEVTPLLAWQDRKGLGRLHLGPDSLEIAFRLEPDQTQLHELLSTITQDLLERTESDP